MTSMGGSLATSRTGPEGSVLVSGMNIANLLFAVLALCYLFRSRNSVPSWYQDLGTCCGGEPEIVMVFWLL